MNTLEETSLTLTRTFAAPRDRVFAALTEPERLHHWFGPEKGSMKDAQVDLRVGGKYRFAVASPDGEEFVMYGEYREVTPPAKLVYTWQFEDDPAYVNHPTLVTVELTTVGETTELRLTHTNFPAVENRNNHQHGWNVCFDNLATYLAS